MSDTTISILGCGWMGLPLGKHLTQLGFSVKGSTTTQGKLSLLRESGVEPFLIRADPQLTGERVEEFFRSKVLFLNIPFSRLLKDPRYYQKQVNSVIERVEASKIEFVIFASSTSVYPASVANAYEDAPFTPDSPRSKVLYEVELSLRNNPKFQTTVIRFAGLYGATRKIGKFMAGRKGIVDADSPVNLIHLQDCVEIVTRIIQEDIRGEVFNACSDGHPSRKEIYGSAARHYGFEPPQFLDRPPEKLKVVSNVKIKERLRYNFIYPDPKQF